MARQGMAPLVISIRQPEDPPELSEPLRTEPLYLPEEKALRAEIDRTRERLPRARAAGDREASRGAGFAADFRGGVARAGAPRARRPARARAFRRDGGAHGVVAAQAVRHRLFLHRPRERYLLRERFPGDE